MTRIAIIGYASLDHVALLADLPQSGRTTTILERPPGAWPRLGGSPAYVAAALVANGLADTFPISWIGADADAAVYRRQLADRRIRDDGVVAVEHSRTPIAIMGYLPDGGCACIYDPGLSDAFGLTATQRHLIGQADWLCVTIGPAAATTAALAALSPRAKLCWVVKHDPRALPLDLARDLAARANLICCSHAERPFVNRALEGQPTPAKQILIETHGGDGAAIQVGSRKWFVPAKPLVVSDPTGAGDSFAGGALAAMAKGDNDPHAIVHAGHDAAQALLAARSMSAPATSAPAIAARG